VGIAEKTAVWRVSEWLAATLEKCPPSRPSTTFSPLKT
jgi:hypothetical protein